MQDRESFQTVKPQFPELEQLKCPRCESTNTKFCYYNNYNLSQPRHFCKNCRRYWTKGGALRNIPVGGSTRKNNSKKRSKPESSVANPVRKTLEASSRSQPEPPSLSTISAIPSLKEAASCSGPDPRGGMYGVAVDPDHKMLDITGSFSSLLAANSGYGSVLEGLNPTNGLGCKMVPMGGFGENFSFREGASHGGGGESSSRSWSGGNGNGNGSGWPDLGIYTPGPGPGPGSNFQTQ